MAAHLTISAPRPGAQEGPMGRTNRDPDPQEPQWSMLAAPWHLWMSSNLFKGAERLWMVGEERRRRRTKKGENVLHGGVNKGRRVPRSGGETEGSLPISGRGAILPGG